MVASGKAERWYGSRSLCPAGEPWSVYRLAHRGIIFPNHAQGAELTAYGLKTNAAIKASWRSFILSL
jgi:hypothetical protein